MKHERVITGIFSLILSAVLLSESHAENVASDYEIHEWGVLAGCGADTNYFNTSRPMKVYAIREPVVYVHSNDKRPFSLKVTFLKGLPTDTFPIAVVSSNTVTWNNVRINDDTPEKARSIPRDTFTALKEIIGILSNTDSDQLSYEEQASKFLFYEGEIPFANKVVAKVNLTNRIAMVSNTGDFPVYDVLLVQPGQQLGPSFLRQTLVGHVDRLDAKQTVQVPLTSTNQISFTSQLTNLDFTEKEAVSFSTLWERPFLQMGNIVYRLAEQECDQMTTLAFEPKPKRCIRALYVVVKP